MRRLGVVRRHLARLLFDDWRVPFAVVSVVASLALASSVYFYVRIQNEGEDRRDQTCKISESKQAKDIRQLRDTYKYLLALSPTEAASTFNVFIRARLGEVEREARLDDAPGFCDEPGTGLREPDPCIPPRPVALGGKPGQPKCLNRPKEALDG